MPRSRRRGRAAASDGPGQRRGPAARCPVQGADDPRQKKPSAQPQPKGEVDPQHLDLTNPFVNPVYQTLDFQIATSRTRIAALERERDELINVKKLGGKELGAAERAVPAAD